MIIILFGVLHSNRKCTRFMAITTWFIRSLGRILRFNKLSAFVMDFEQHGISSVFKKP